MAQARRNTPPRLLVSVRWGKHVGFDRTVFEFAEGLPGYRLEYIDHPIRQCGSGQVLPVVGDGWLEVRLHVARAHDNQGHASIPQQEFAPELQVVREIQRACDFEGYVTYVLGTTAPNRYRVLELASPPRLVVDVLHRN